MKKNGFTLIELLVCFILITFVSLSLFKTVLSLSQKQIKNISYNEYLTFASVLSNTLQKDFEEKKITSFVSCGTNCYDITYEGNGIIRLSINKSKRTFTYGNTTETLPNSYMFYSDLMFNSYESGDIPDGVNKYITITIPIKDKNSVSYSDIKYMYQYSDNISFS